jgi:hypothetical protein
MQKKNEQFYISVSKRDKKIVNKLIGKTLFAKKGFVVGRHPFDLRVNEEEKIFIEIKPKSDFFVTKNNELCIKKFLVFRILDKDSPEFSEEELITLLVELKNTHEFYLRKKVVKHIKDQNILFNIALTDDHYDIRAEAINKIEDDLDLIKILEETGVLFLRLNLIRKIKDKNFLRDVVLNDPDYDVRRTALEKLNDDDLLIKVVKFDDSWVVRLAATKKIRSKEVLDWVFKNDEEECVRNAAKIRL